MYFLHTAFVTTVVSTYLTVGCSTAADGYNLPDAVPPSPPPPDAELPSGDHDAAWVPSFCAVGSWGLTATYVDGTCSKPFLDFEKSYTVTLVVDRYRVEEENGLEVLVDAYQDAAGACRASLRELSDGHEDGPLDLLFDLTSRGQVVTGVATISHGTSQAACIHTFTVTGAKLSSTGSAK